MAKNLDPTRTTVLRRSFMREMGRRFRALSKAIFKLIVEEDALGLVVAQPVSFNAAVQIWRFKTDTQKVAAYRQWLEDQVNAGILAQTDGVSGKPWTSTYIESAHRKGAVRAYTDLRKQKLAADPTQFAGGRAEFLRTAFSQPELLSKVELLSTRAYNELKGVTDTMSQQMSRILANGLANGHHPRKIAAELRKNVSTMTKTRANVIARTEIVAAHAEGQLDSFELLGETEVGILAEWSTAGDDLVCPLCAPLEGAVFAIKEARGILPRHPNCRCAWIPADASDSLLAKKQRAGQLRGSERAGALGKSVKEQGGSRSSTWAGKTLLKKKTTPVSTSAKKVADTVKKPAPPTPPPPKPKGPTRFESAEEYRQYLIAEVDKANVMDEAAMIPLRKNQQQAAKRLADYQNKQSEMKKAGKWFDTQKGQSALTSEAEDVFKRGKEAREDYERLSKEIIKLKKSSSMSTDRMLGLLAEEDSLAGLYEAGTIPSKYSETADRLLDIVPRSKLGEEEIRRISLLDAKETTTLGRGVGGLYTPEGSFGGTLRINSKIAGNKQRFFAHEFGHHLSSTINGFLRKQKMFFTQRTAKESIVSFDKYVGVVGKKDKFANYDVYAGRLYDNGGPMEISSVGIEHMFLNPYRAAKKDPEWFNMIIRSLKKLDK